jgi:hypothetical protein
MDQRRVGTRHYGKALLLAIVLVSIGHDVEEQMVPS